MSDRKRVAKRRKRLSIEALEPRRLLDVSGIWQELGFRSASGGGVTYNSFNQGNTQPDMELDVQQRPYVAHAENGHIFVTAYNGFAWTPIGGRLSDAGPTPWGNWDPDIELDFQDTPYVVWQHLDGDTGYDIHLKYYDGEAWRELGGSATDEGISADGVNNYEPSLVIGRDGLPIVAYTAYDETGYDYDIVVKKWDGTQWVELTNTLPFGAQQGTTTTLFGGGVSNDTFDSTNPELAIDKSGFPILVWSSQANEQDREIYVRQWTGSEWRELGDDSASGPAGKYGAQDPAISTGISDDSGESIYPVVDVTEDNTVVVAWMNYQNYSLRNEAGIFVKKYAQGDTNPTWQEYSPGSATDYGIVGEVYPSLLGPTFTFVDMKMDIGPHFEDVQDTATDYEHTPAITWVSSSYGSETWVARFNPKSGGWEYLVGDGDDPMVTEPIDGPTPWSVYNVAIPTYGLTPDATGYRNVSTSVPTVGIDQETGREILAYSARSGSIYGGDSGFPDSEIYVQQYQSTTDYYEIRDLDPNQTVDLTLAWDTPNSTTGDLYIQVLDANGRAIRAGDGSIDEVAPEVYEHAPGDERGLIRIKVMGTVWAEQTYTLTADQGGSTQSVTEAEPNDEYLDRHVVNSGSGNMEARTVEIAGSLNNEWIEVSPGSMSPGGVDDSTARTSNPRMATSHDGRPIMAFIDSNTRWSEDVYRNFTAPDPNDAWIETKIWDETLQSWVDLTSGPPIQSDVISRSLQIMPSELGSNLEQPIMRLMDISSDQRLLTEWDSRIFLAVSDGEYIEVYESDYNQTTGLYEPWEPVDTNPVITAPADPDGTINWISVQAGPEGEVALAYEWFYDRGMPARSTSYDVFKVESLDSFTPVDISAEFYDPQDPSGPPPPYTGSIRIQILDEELDEDENVVVLQEFVNSGTVAIENIMPVDDDPASPEPGYIFVRVVHDRNGGYYRLNVDQGGMTFPTVEETEPNNDLENADIFSLGEDVIFPRRFTIEAKYDYPMLGSSDVYVALYNQHDGTWDWDPMGSGALNAPSLTYGEGGLTNNGQARWPDLAFVPDPDDPPGTGNNLAGSYVMAWSYGVWDEMAGEDPEQEPPEPWYESGFQRFGVKLAWFDKNVGTGTGEWINTQKMSNSLNRIYGSSPQTDALFLWPRPPATPDLYQAIRRWPSVTVGAEGQPFVSWTTEIYSTEFEGDEGAEFHPYLGSWITAYQWGSGVSEFVSTGDVDGRLGRAEVIDDVLMSEALTTAGQLPVVTWQSLDVDVTKTTPDPTFTLGSHYRLTPPARPDAEFIDYDIKRPWEEDGASPHTKLQEIHLRRYNPNTGSWEQMNSQNWYADSGEFTSTDNPGNQSKGDGLEGIDQFWSSGFWPDIALVTDPSIADDQPVVSWLNQSEQTVYLRVYNQLYPKIDVLISGSEEEDAINFGATMAGVPTARRSVTIENLGNEEVRITEINIGGPFQRHLTPIQQQALNGAGIVIPAGGAKQFEVSFAPEPDEAGLFYNVLEIVSTDPDRPLYQIALSGASLTGAVIELSEVEGVENDLVLPFGYVEPGETKSATFTIKNSDLATGTLHVERMFASLPGLFELSTESVTLQPGQSTQVTVTFKPPTNLPALPAYDTLALYSNDIENPRTFIQLIGNAPALFNPVQATETDGSEQDVSISSDFVAYVRGSNQGVNGEPTGPIYVYDRSTGQETDAPIGTGRDPKVWGEWVIFTGGLYDTTTGVTYSFQDMPELNTTTISHVSVSGDRFAVSTNGLIKVFEIDRTKLRADGEWGLQVGADQVVRQVWDVPSPVADATNDYPALWRDWIAWRSAPTSSSRTATDKAVFLYEYAATNPAEPTQISGATGAPGHMIPQFDNHRVLWMDDRYGADNPQILIWDVDKQSRTVLTNSFSDKGAHFAYTGNLVVWSDNRSGNWDLYAIDLSEWEQLYNLYGVPANEYQLTFDKVAGSDGLNQANPAVSGAWIAYQDDGPDKTQWDLIVAQFPGPPELGVRETTGSEVNDDIVDFGNVNLGVTKGVSFELHNIGYDVLTVDGYTLADLGAESVDVYRYVDANSNSQWDAGEDRFAWNPGEALPGLDVGEFHSIWVEWSPSSGTASLDAMMTVTSDAEENFSYDVSLVGQGVLTPDMVVSVGTLDFGQVPVGTSAFIDVTITNQGNQDLLISDIVPTNTTYFRIEEIAGDMTISPGGTDSYIFRVWFDADLVGSFSGQGVKIFNNDPEFVIPGQNPPFFQLLPIQAEAINAPDIAVYDTTGNPVTELDFGAVETGRYKDLVLVIKNEGQAQLRLDELPGGFLSSNADVLKLVGAWPTNAINPGQTVQITVRFEPTSDVSYAGSWIELASNDPDYVGNPWGAPAEAPLRVTVSSDTQGVRVPHIAVHEQVGSEDDDRIDFGILNATPDGTREVTFTVENTGSADLSISSISIVGDAEFDLLGLPTSFVLQPGQTRTGTIRLDSSAPGTFAATLTVVSNDPDDGASPYEVSLNAKVRAGQLVILPSTLNFGEVEPGETSVAQEFVLTNAGDAALTITGVSSSNPAFELIVPQAYAGQTFTLAPGATSQAFRVVFKPTAEQAYTGRIRVTSDDPANGTIQSPALVGSGVNVPNIVIEEPGGVVTDGRLEFGQVRMGESSTQTITVRNTGTDTLRITDWSSDNVAYTVRARGWVGAEDIFLAPGTEVVMEITFTPPSTTTYPGNVIIQSDDPDPSDARWLISVTGTGLPPQVAGDLTGDGRLDSQDYDLFKNAFGSTSQDPTWNPVYDFDDDGDVDFSDLGIFLAYYNQQSKLAPKTMVASYLTPLSEGAAEAVVTSSSLAVNASTPSTKLSGSAKATSEDDGNASAFYRGLSDAFHTGALSEDAAAESSSATSPTAQTAGVDDVASPDPVTSPKATQVAQGQGLMGGGAVVSSLPLSMGSDIRQAASLSVNDLGEVDSLLSSYASALLPSEGV